MKQVVLVGVAAGADEVDQRVWLAAGEVLLVGEVANGVYLVHCRTNLFEEVHGLI